MGDKGGKKDKNKSQKQKKSKQEQKAKKKVDKRPKRTPWLDAGSPKGSLNESRADLTPILNL